MSKTIKIEKRTPLHIQEQRQLPQKRQNQPSVYDTFRKNTAISQQEERQRTSPLHGKDNNYQML